MKSSSVWDKLLLLLLIVLVAAAGVWAVCLSVHIAQTDDAMRMLSFADDGFLYRMPFGIAGLLLVAAAVRVAWAFLLRRAAQAQETAPVTIRKGEHGALQISAEALDTMIKQYCKSRPAVQACDTAVTPKGEGADLRLHVALTPDADISASIIELQTELRDYLKTACGLDVTNIDVVLVPHNERK